MNRDEPAAWNNMAEVFSDLGKFEETPGLFQRSLQCHEKQGTSPSWAKNTLLGFAYSMMRLGQFQYIWPAWEVARMGMTWHPFPGTFAWKGEAVDRLLVVPEGGFGDGFMFLRWIPRLSERVGQTTVLIWDSLLEYAQRALGQYATVLPMSHEFKYDELAQFRCCTALLSLPGMLGMQSWDDIPPALTWEPSARVIAPPLDQVGFCWSAEENGVQRRTRSLDCFAADKIGRELAKRCERVVSLVPRGKTLYRDAVHAAPKGVTQDDAALASWEETARTILKCRLVVTVDTAVAHLAGSLGVPTLVLLPLRVDWKWGWPGHDLPPWYGLNFHAFRNDHPEAWNVDGILSAIKALGV